MYECVKCMMNVNIHTHIPIRYVSNFKILPTDQIYHFTTRVD